MFKKKKKPPTLVWVKCRACGGDTIHPVFVCGTRKGVAAADFPRNDLEYSCQTKGRKVPLAGGDELVVLEKRRA